MINNGDRKYNCVRERIEGGNCAYFANIGTLKSKIISRAAKIQVNKALIRPVATYGAEAWMLTLTDENSLSGG
jgi:hypothetical protein